MQTQPLPIQVSSASATPAPNRANANQGADAMQFRQALSREMEQRQPAPAPAPAAAKPAAQAKQQVAPTPQNPDAPSPAPGAAQATPAEGKSADAGTEEARDDAAAAAATDPVVDMLALVASFNQPLAPAAAPVSSTPLAAATAMQGADLQGYAATKETDLAPLATDGTALPAGIDDAGLSFKDVAQAIDGAARLSMKAPEPAPQDAALTTARAATTAEEALTALAAGAAQKADPNGAVAAKADGAAEAGLKPQVLQADTALRSRETVADAAALKEPAAAAPVMAPVQQASLAMAQAVSGAPADRIAARVGTPAWDNQVSQKIVWMVAGKEQTASLTLNPPDMGPMQVVLSVTNDQATVTFSAAQPEVRQALENALPKLREMMGESGISLGNASVNDGAAQRQAQQGEQSRGQGGGTRMGRAGESEPGVAPAPRLARMDGSAGMVDTFA